jgi:hypothetical protein
MAPSKVKVTHLADYAIKEDAMEKSLANVKDAVANVLKVNAETKAKKPNDKGFYKTDEIAHQKALESIIEYKRNNRALVKSGKKLDRKLVKEFPKINRLGKAGSNRLSTESVTALSEKLSKHDVKEVSPLSTRMAKAKEALRVHTESIIIPKKNLRRKSKDKPISVSDATVTESLGSAELTQQGSVSADGNIEVFEAQPPKQATAPVDNTATTATTVESTVDKVDADDTIRPGGGDAAQLKGEEAAAASARDAFINRHRRSKAFEEEKAQMEGEPMPPPTESVMQEPVDEGVTMAPSVPIQGTTQETGFVNVLQDDSGAALPTTSKELFDGVGSETTTPGKSIGTLKDTIKSWHSIYDKFIPEFTSPAVEKHKQEALKSKNIAVVKIHYNQMEDTIKKYYQDQSGLKLGVVISADAYIKNFLIRMSQPIPQPMPQPMPQPQPMPPPMPGTPRGEPTEADANTYFSREGTEESTPEEEHRRNKRGLSDTDGEQRRRLTEETEIKKVEQSYTEGDASYYRKGGDPYGYKIQEQNRLAIQGGMTRAKRLGAGAPLKAYPFKTQTGYIKDAVLRTDDRTGYQRFLNTRVIKRFTPEFKIKG